jgi:hypothetical protein
LHCWRKSDVSVAIDLFDQQNLDVDQSGGGSRAVFEQNLNLYNKHKGKNVRILDPNGKGYR